MSVCGNVAILGFGSNAVNSRSRAVDIGLRITPHAPGYGELTPSKGIDFIPPRCGHSVLLPDGAFGLAVGRSEVAVPLRVREGWSGATELQGRHAKQYATEQQPCDQQRPEDVDGLSQ